MKDKQLSSGGQGKGTLSSHGDEAEAIRIDHEAAMASAQDALERAIRIGAKLNRVKAEKAHGEFIPWLLANCPFNERTARRYMEAARGWDEIEGKTDSLSDLTLTKVLGLMAEDRQSKEAESTSGRAKWEQSDPGEGPFLPAHPNSAFAYTSHVEFADGSLGRVEICPSLEHPGFWHVDVTQIYRDGDMEYVTTIRPVAWILSHLSPALSPVAYHIPDHFRDAVAAAGWKTRDAATYRSLRYRLEETE